MYVDLPDRRVANLECSSPSGMMILLLSERLALGAGNCNNPRRIMKSIERVGYAAGVM